MLDIFTREDMCKLLQYKNIVFLGDSNIRAIYKDFLCLLHSNEFIAEGVLRQKMEDSCCGDSLLYHGQKSNGRNYREERAANINGTRVAFYFLTRVYDSYVKGVLKQVTCRKPPDVMVINSCLWDVTRWGPTGVEDYKENMKELMQELKKQAPDSLVIWVTTPPIAQEMKGGFLLQELQFLKYSLRFHIVEANHYARKVVVENGFDVLDTHYHLKFLIQKRSGDGIHWFAETVRFITNLLLTHISLAWDEPLPHRYNSEAMQENLNMVLDEEASNAQEIQVSVAPEASTSTSQKKTENLNSPQKKTNCKENSANRWTKNHNRQTHHAYFSRQQHKNRMKRIKKSKQATYMNHSPPGKFCNNDSDGGYLSKFNLSDIRQSYQNTVSKRTVELSSPTSSFSHYDSGYFSSPNPAYSSYSPPMRRPSYFNPLNRQTSNPFPQYNPVYQPNLNFTSDEIEGYYF